jgi:DNA polymerase-4
MGITTIAELRATELILLKQHLGTKVAESFHQQAHGIASSTVVTGRQRKSISKERTFNQDIEEHARLRDTLLELATSVARTARQENLAGTVVTLKIRYTGFETFTRQTTLSAPTDDERVLLTTVWPLFTQGDLPDKPVRLIGIGLSGWTKLQATQSDLFAQPERQAADKKILEAIDTVTKKFGKPILQVGMSREIKK